jgi:L-alanine-DL-glutamate epimerase-like enolase superfamily enzyme
MEITDVTVHTLSTAGVEVIGDGTQDAAIIEVETDEGITGINEADSSPAVVETIVEAPTSHVKARGLKEILLDRDPFDIEVLWEEMFEATYFFGWKGAAINAISGVDMALWDIKGKATGKPLYKLLGGAHRDSARAYASTLFSEDPTDTEAVLEAAERVRDDGFTAAKFGWGAIGDSQPRAHG